MSKNGLSCCGVDIKSGELWFLNDFKGYTKRKLYIGRCSVCGDDAVLQIMTSTETGETYYNLYNGIEAVKVLYREKKKKLVTLPNIDSQRLYGWIYGINKEIRNKSGKVTQIRQYASDYSGRRKLVKTIKFQ